jgi:acetoin utilization deacetylase AcuC-like enzyme
MKVIFTDEHRKHDGAMEFLNGKLVPMFEMPRRMDMVMDRVRSQGFKEILPPQPIGLEPARRVHSDAFLEFLSVAWERWHRDWPKTTFAAPFTFAMRRLGQKPGKSAVSQFGYWCFDLSSPFVPGTWDAIKAAHDVAITGQRLVAGGERAVFSVCRPPGHHAMKDMAGGYCYINNAASAAQAFRDGGAAKVAVLDVDYHHGNGTQDIFYDRDDVLFVSLHGHPDQEYPYFLGYAEETGSGKGEGFNVNYPLPWGTGWDSYRQALADGIGKVEAFRPDALVVSLGVDTFEADPISHFKLKSPDYLEMGAMIAALNKPTLSVMEGGYAVEEIGINAVNVLTGFMNA